MYERKGYDPYRCGRCAGNTGFGKALGGQMRSVTVTEPIIQEELKNVDAKVYSTYYTTRKDNAWAKGKSGRDSADVYYDSFLYSSGRGVIHSSDEPSVSGYAEGQ